MPKTLASVIHPDPTNTASVVNQISSWINQSVNTTSSPTFAAINLTSGGFGMTYPTITPGLGTNCLAATVTLAQLFTNGVSLVLALTVDVTPFAANTMSMLTLPLPSRTTSFLAADEAIVVIQGFVDNSDGYGRVQVTSLIGYASPSSTSVAVSFLAGATTHTHTLQMHVHYSSD